MQMVKWALIWITLVLAGTGLYTYLEANTAIAMWPDLLRAIGGIFFAISLVVGGVLTTESAFRARKRSFYREDWSFICLLVTVFLFSISYMIV